LYAVHTSNRGLELKPRQNYFLSLNPHQGFHKIAYVEWGNEHSSRVLICAHGLTRNSRDFDFLAKSLSSSYRIVCPDLVGRGESDYLGIPAIYNFAQYLSDMTSLLARLNAKEVHWLGTSLGGIIGMMLAAQPHSPINSLILNDIGMIIPSTALQRLETYARNTDSFSSFEEAKNYFQTILSPFGSLESEKWDHITKYGTKQRENGKFYLSYDPVIGQMCVNKATPSLHLEAYWQAIRCPSLVLRGEDSDFLLPDIIRKMIYFQPNTKVKTIPYCGHAPSLMVPQQIQIIEEWLKNQ
jgi:pimeloyl-ACP methyl ester carboxylesterase